jgi:hypothetical protein
MKLFDTRIALLMGTFGLLSVGCITIALDSPDDMQGVEDLAEDVEGGLSSGIIAGQGSERGLSSGKIAGQGSDR